MDKIFLVKAYQEVGEDTTRTDFNKMVELSPQEVEKNIEKTIDDCSDWLIVEENNDMCKMLLKHFVENLLKKLESIK